MDKIFMPIKINAISQPRPGRCDCLFGGAGGTELAIAETNTAALGSEISVSH